MSIDSGGRVKAPKPLDLWRLPEITDITIYRIRFKRPRRFTILGKDRVISETIAFTIFTSEPFVIRALGPVLFVGDTALTVAEGEGDRRYRFLAPEPQRLKTGSPIFLAWNTSDPPRKATRFKYEPPSAVLEDQ
jgi:hypothetical protein